MSALSNDSILIEKIEMNFQDSVTNSDKFYNVSTLQDQESNEYTVYRHYGRVGSNTTPQPIMTTAFPQDAARAVQKAVSAKRKKGYEISNHFKHERAYLIDKSTQVNKDTDSGKGVYVADKNNLCYLLCRKQKNGNTYLSCYDPQGIDSPWRTCAVAVGDTSSCEETYFAQVSVLDKLYEGLQTVLIVRSLEDIEDAGVEEEDCQLTK
ncbi:WGR domain-containing protein [Photobacterium toruni]|uniref:WGR domain-containing protein n=1 Tax=Photobacterium toruni TaxID=1935446 RepID=UPI0021106D3B|nr:WGR domain-containing protein [Photobacterium toruni]